MITHKFVVRKERNNAVMLRLTANRKSSELSLGISVPPEILDEILTGETPKGYKEQALVIKHHQNVMLDLFSRMTDNEAKAISASDFQKRMRDEIYGRRNTAAPVKKGNIIPVFNDKMASLSHSGTRGIYKMCLDRIKEFCQDSSNTFRKDPEQLMFDDINHSWLAAFDTWMAETRGLKVNTRWMYLVKFRAIANKALDDEVIQRDPFRRFKIRKEETRKRSLSVEDLRLLFNYPATPKQQYHIDMFKLIFMLCGINVADLFNLKSITRNGRIEYRRAKTGKLYSIKVEPEAMEIIKKYKGEKNLLSIADRKKTPKLYTVHIDNMLKRIGALIDAELVQAGKKDSKEESDLPRISTYWARHSWASIAAELDIPDAVISQALGHNSDTNPTTAIYIKRNQKKIDEANRRVIDFVLYGDKDRSFTVEGKN